MFVTGTLLLICDDVQAHVRFQIGRLLLIILNAAGMTSNLSALDPVRTPEKRPATVCTRRLRKTWPAFPCRSFLWVSYDGQTTVHHKCGSCYERCRIRGEEYHR